MLNFLRKIFNKKKTIVPKNVVVYTAIFGDKDKLVEPRIKPRNVDFVCFTDSDNLKSKNWRVIKIEGIENDFTRSARRVKILAHKYVSQYEFSVWVDGNLLVRGDVNILIEKYLKNQNLAIFNHFNNKDSRDCIYEEAKAIFAKMEIGRYKNVSREEIEKQIDKYKKENYPEHNGLAVTMVILRRHNSIDVVKTMEDWWQEVKNFSKRDQISFNYSAWKTDFKFVFLPGDSRDNKFFKWTPHAK